MSYNIALQFEDGVSRIIPCDADELVCDAAYRAKINIPLDCRDGACGTCKCHCESRQLHPGCLHRGRPDRGRGRQRLCADLPDEADLRLRRQGAGLVGGLQDRRSARTAATCSINRDSATTVSSRSRPSVPLAFCRVSMSTCWCPAARTRARIRSARRRTRRAIVPDSRRARRHDEHLHAPQGQGRRLHDVHRPLRQFLPAPGAASGADARRRHRSGAVPVDAAVAKDNPPTSRSAWPMASTPTTTWSSSTSSTNSRRRCPTSTSLPPWWIRQRSSETGLRDHHLSAGPA